MCRWLAYTGTPILLEELLYKPEHSLIDQSQHSRLRGEGGTTNGDGFGVGWYTEPSDDPLDADDTPALFRGLEPAWSNRNLRDLSTHVRSSLFFAHVRASSPGTAVQESNCHPFRHGRWLWMHNGGINRFPELRRDLMLAINPALFPLVEGTTDTEAMFYLALTLGLTQDVPGAVERMADLVEATAERHAVPDAVQMTLAVSDGTRLWAFRYSSSPPSPSLFYSTSASALLAVHPENENLRRVSDKTRVVVSEPLTDLSDAWLPVEESSYSVIEDGKDETFHFAPQRA
ncbi:class II glutamine amidotransferase [Kitasatospora kifunensis]|uniref:Glutamine amidotransferase n=1 Tax=Kitasatospora kifunensis TaxID=58351 RepID=A0A7W7VXK3_KITKI|nr:class II glutamine amidotransferase [Kitasatospora kifunensis]MBB4926727.1 glutamine amidotransferase [Kitasatospora kifunensis]